MPCDTVRTTTMELEAADRGLLFKAMEALGLQPQLVGAAERQSIRFAGGQWVGGRVVTTDRSFDVNAVKREYSRQTIVATARRQGWQLRFRPNGEIEATKRRFA